MFTTVRLTTLLYTQIWIKLSIYLKFRIIPLFNCIVTGLPQRYNIKVAQQKLETIFYYKKYKTKPLNVHLQSYE